MPGGAALFCAGDDERIRIVGDRCVRKNGTCTFDFQTCLVLHLAADDDSQGNCIFELDLSAGGNGFDVLVDIGDGFELHSSLRTHRHWRKRKGYRFTLPNRPTTVLVKVVKRTEPQAMQVLPPITVKPAVLHGLTLSHGYRLSEPTLPERRVEFVGDSDIAAFGSEGRPTLASGLNFFGLALNYQNVRSSWAYALAGMLGAEASIVAWSGVGVVQNALHCGRTLLGEYYERALATVAGSRLDFAASAWTPQLVVIQVGANDLYGGTPPPSVEAFVGAYVALLALIRRRRPAPCVMVCCLARLDCPAYLTQGYRNGDASGPLQSSIGAAFERYRRDSGDDLVYLVTCEEAELHWPDDGGTIEHWNAAGHAKYAQNLRDTMERDGILRKLGWAWGAGAPSDCVATAEHI